MREKAMSSDEFKRRRDAGEFGEPALSGWQERHDALVNACIVWLCHEAGPGLYAFRCDTGRFTAGRVFGTPGVADILGWRQLQPFEAGGPILPTPIFMAVECKVADDKLNENQIKFRDALVAAGGIHIVSRWDGEHPDKTRDLREKWKEATDGQA